MGPLAADTKHSNSETLETARRGRQPRQERSARTASPSEVAKESLDK